METERRTTRVRRMPGSRYRQGAGPDFFQSELSPDSDWGDKLSSCMDSDSASGDCPAVSEPEKEPSQYHSGRSRHGTDGERGSGLEILNRRANRRRRFEAELDRAAQEAAHMARSAPPAPPSGFAWSCSSAVGDGVFAGVMWLQRIRMEYGSRLLLLLFASQHILKGVVQQFQASAVMWLLREYRVSGPSMQVYVSVSNSAWALKPIIGLISDLVPVLGYRKAPYIILTAFIGIICTTTIGLSSKAVTSVQSVVLCLFGMQLQASTTDLLTEATYSESIQEKPQSGPDLITYVWGGITIGNMTAVSCVSWLISNFGPRSVFLACIVPCSAIIYPTLMNYFDEVAYTRHQLARVRQAFLKQKEVLFLCGLMTMLTFTLTVVGTVTHDHDIHFRTAVAILVTMVSATSLLLRPEIAKVNSFFMMQAALSVNINGATFYFYTDTAEQYPEGPHFSPWFFTTALGLVASVMSLLGLATYTQYMKNWTYRSLLVFSNLLVTLLALLDIVMFRRLNLEYGIPDRFFVLGSSVATVVIRQWQWMPGVVVMSQLCPVGMEATMFALLAGCMNLGNQIADFLGAYLLAVLEVHPRGALNESHEFANLWKASCVSTLLPGITVVLIPLLMPPQRQTEKLLFIDSTSATAGSLWSTWFGGGSRERMGVPQAASSHQHVFTPAQGGATPSDSQDLQDPSAQGDDEAREIR
eukprot:TRINITY_DN37904_c0_g2_i1.p1 TRINITY_DN37904_c0_g2~~TRINITY_DN37904_c0_g2_i1.p1  ORF type:complete len:698 (-),score=113.59 TRINITY_DN37904_c0_g2_i1:74-2167(-)